MIIYDPRAGSSTRVIQDGDFGGYRRGSGGSGGGGVGGCGDGSSSMGSGAVLGGDWSFFNNHLAWVTEDRYLHVCSEEGKLLGTPRRLKSKAESLSFGASPHGPDNDCILAINLSGKSLLIYNTNAIVQSSCILKRVTGASCRTTGTVLAKLWWPSLMDFLLWSQRWKTHYIERSFALIARK